MRPLGKHAGFGDEEYIRSAAIDPTAIIHRLALVENAQVGPRTQVWQFASVIRRAIVGADCKIASCAIIDGSTVGDRCIVSHGAFIGPGMRIGNDVFIGPHVVFCNDAWPRVSKEDFDMAGLLADDVTVTIVRDGASLGAGAIVLPGRLIGAGAMIAAGAVVDADVPEGWLVRRDGKREMIYLAHSPRRIRAARSGVPVGR